MSAIGSSENAARGAVLVADDTNVMRHACQRALERAGHRVVIASNGDEAIKIAASGNIDVALLDIKMPGPSGIDVLKEIKSAFPLVEVIMMTAYATRDIAEEAVRIGASDFLTKPFSNIRSLTETVGRAVARKRLMEKGCEGDAKVDELLVKNGLLTPEELERARKRAQAWKIPVEEALTRMCLVKPEDMDEVLAKALDMPFVRLKAEEIDEGAVKLLPGHVARRHRLMPVRLEGNLIHIAVNDPFDRHGLKSVRLYAGREPFALKGYGPEIDEMIRRFYPWQSAPLEELAETLTEQMDPLLLRELFSRTEIARLTDIRVNPVEGPADDGPAQTPSAWAFRIEGVIIEPKMEEE